MQSPAIGNTDWQAVIVSAWVPAAVAAALLYSAFTPQSAWSDEWLDSLLILWPIELVRVVVFSLIGDARLNHKTPKQALGGLLAGFAALFFLLLSFAVPAVGFRGIFAALGHPQFLHAFEIPVFVIIAEGAVEMYFFGGNSQRAVARIHAAAGDASDWFKLVAIPLPFVVAIAYCALVLLRQTKVILPAWIPDPHSQALRVVCLTYAAAYFIGKALLLAYVHTARFQRSGRRLLIAPAIQFLLTRDKKAREKLLRREADIER